MERRNHDGRGRRAACRIVVPEAERGKSRPRAPACPRVRRRSVARDLNELRGDAPRVTAVERGEAPGIEDSSKNLDPVH